jgi:hypothetical protein
MGSPEYAMLVGADVGADAGAGGHAEAGRDDGARS